MEAPKFGHNEDGDDNDPSFFNLDEEIRKLLDETSTHKDIIINLETTYQTKHHELTAKILKLQEQLNNIHTEKYDAMRKARDKYDEDMRRLAALRIQKRQEDENAAFEETARLIKEICKDFEAWTAAREYQVEDVVRIVHQYLIGSSGVMNANEMSLGKTFESIVALYIIRMLFEQKHGRKPTMLWLTKASIVQTGGTKNEATRWDPTLKMFPLKGSDAKASREMVFKFASMGSACVLTNYETLRTTPEARKVQWDIVVMDEVHKLKGGANANGPTAIWEAVKNTVDNAQFIMMLTGTPLVNRIEEIWSYLHIFDADVFNDPKRFARQFNAFKDMSGKLQFSLQSERLLKDILKGRLIRRTAHEVGLQMPPVTEQDIVLPHNLEQGDLYNKMRTDFFIWLDQQEGKALTAASILAQLTRLRQINVLPVAKFEIKDSEGNVVETMRLDVRDSSKLDEAIDIIKATNDQVIVFSNFNEPMEELAFRLSVEGFRSAIISSKYSKEMASFETGFQKGEIDVLMINSAMGEGLNLHKDAAKWEGGARAVITLDRWWNPARNRQMIARAVRPETDQSVKEREPVMVYNLYCSDSVDYFIKSLCDEKAAQFDAITEAKELRPSSEWKSYLKGLL